MYAFVFNQRTVESNVEFGETVKRKRFFSIVFTWFSHPLLWALPSIFPRLFPLLFAQLYITLKCQQEIQ